MTREERLFGGILLISLALHALLLAVIIALPAGGPSQAMKVYTVRIVEVPNRPEARELILSTELISALKLESPTLSLKAPPLPESADAEVPEAEKLPPALPVPKPPAQASLTPPDAKPPAEKTGIKAPQSGPPSALPHLPSIPAPAVPPSASAPRAAAPPPPAVEDEPRRPSAMERLRSRVRTLNLRVEASAPALVRPDRFAPAATERNLLSLRLYANRVREAVKEQYTFPGGFPANLLTRVRVVLLRDGSVQRAELLESSGNTRFDNLVCLAAINKAQIPAIPLEIDAEDDTLTLHFSCSP